MGKILRLTLGVIAALVLMLSFNPAVHAQATRTWVSGTGADANPGSRTAPCQTFASAYSKTAAGGEIDAIDPGGFGTITISKAITIDGGGGQVASVLATATFGITVSAGPNDIVILRNIRINGVSQYTNPGLTGIRFISGKALYIENCYIDNFSQKGIDAEMTATGSSLFVSDCKITNCDTGIMVKTTTGTVKAVIDNTKLVGMNYGLLAGDGSVTTVNNSLCSLSTYGIANQAVSIPSTLVAEYCIFDSNLVGVSTSGLAAITLSNATVEGNGYGLSSPTGQIISFGNNRLLENDVNGAPTSVVAPF